MNSENSSMKRKNYKSEQLNSKNIHNLAIPMKKLESKVKANNNNLKIAKEI